MKTILHFVSIMDRAGQETFIMNVFRCIVRTSFKFKFLCTHQRKGDYDDEIKTLGGEIYYTEKEKHSPLRIYKYLHIINSWTKTFKQIDFDVLHLHNYHAFSVFIQLLVAKIAGVKSVIVHCHNANAPLPTLHKIFKIVIKLFKFHKVACSEIAAIWMFGSLKNVTIVKNGIIASDFRFNAPKRETLRKELNIENKTVLLHIGRFNYQKNHSFLLDIFHEYLKLNNNAVLILVGRGELENQIVEKINRLEISDKVLLLGVKSNIADILSASDFFIFPSLFEGLPVILVEAQTNGIYCVFSNTISQESIFSNKVTILPLENSHVWAKEIQRVQILKYDRSAGVDSAINSGFDVKSITEQVVTIYSKL